MLFLGWLGSRLRVYQEARWIKGVQDGFLWFGDVVGVSQASVSWLPATVSISDMCPLHAHFHAMRSHDFPEIHGGVLGNLWARCGTSCRFPWSPAVLACRGKEGKRRTSASCIQSRRNERGYEFV